MATFVENPELSKLRKDIITEGINKKSYESAEEENSDSDDSDNEMLMKFVPKKNKKNGKVDFDSVAYAFTLTNRLSKMRSELARIEERMRYLQLDYNNKEIKIEEQQTLITTFENKVKDDFENIKKYNILITRQHKQINILHVSNGVFIAINMFFVLFSYFN